MLLDCAFVLLRKKMHGISCWSSNGKLSTAPTHRCICTMLCMLRQTPSHPVPPMHFTISPNSSSNQLHCSIHMSSKYQVPSKRTTRYKALVSQSAWGIPTTVCPPVQYSLVNTVPWPLLCATVTCNWTTDTTSSL